MFKKLLFTIFLLFNFVTVFAQESFEVYAFGGYTGQNNFAITGGSALIEAGPAFGGSINYAPQPGFSFELFYSRQETILNASSSFENIRIREDGNVSYWMLGVSPVIPSSVDNLNFFTTFRLGGVTFSTKSDEFESSVKLATSLSGGLAYNITENFGIKASANLFLPIFDAGATLWFGGGGGGVGASAWCPILQLNGNAGLFYTFSR